MIKKRSKSSIKKIETEWLYVLATILVATERAHASENAPHLHMLNATDDQDISLFDVLLTQDTDAEDDDDDEEQNQTETQTTPPDSSNPPTNDEDQQGNTNDASFRDRTFYDPNPSDFPGVPPWLGQSFENPTIPIFPNNFEVTQIFERPQINPPPITPPLDIDLIDDFFNTLQDQAIDLNIVLNDIGLEQFLNPFDFLFFSTPLHGTISLLPSGIIHYTPNPGFSGIDTFTYLFASNLNGIEPDIATVTINVTPKEEEFTPVIAENQDGDVVGTLASLFPGINPALISLTGSSQGALNLGLIFVIENGVVKLITGESLDVGESNVSGGLGVPITLSFDVNGSPQQILVDIQNNSDEAKTFDMNIPDDHSILRNITGFNQINDTIVVLNIPTGHDLCDVLDFDFTPFTNHYVFSLTDPLVDDIIGRGILPDIPLLATQEMFFGDGTSTFRVLLGDNGNNQINAQDFNTSTPTHQFDDIIFAFDGNDQIFGDLPIVNGTSDEIGNDCLHGGAGSDILFGDIEILNNLQQEARFTEDFFFIEEEEFFGFVGGNDEMNGGSGNDALYGDVRVNNGFLQKAGDDILNGGTGDDILVGDVGINKATFSLAGRDTLFGGEGDDILSGDIAQTDGGFAQFAAVDKFVYDFGIHNGNDRITDLNALGNFDPTLKPDILQFKGVADVVGAGGIGGPGNGVDSADLDALTSVEAGDGIFSSFIKINLFADTLHTISKGSILIEGVHFTGDTILSQYTEVQTAII